MSLEETHPEDVTPIARTSSLSKDELDMLVVPRMEPLSSSSPPPSSAMANGAAVMEEQDLEMGNVTARQESVTEVNVNIPRGAFQLVNLFNPPNGETTVSAPTNPLYTRPEPPRTPPPKSIPEHDSLSCPSTPSGLTWRKAGSTFNLYPHTLIPKRLGNTAVRLEQRDALPRLVKRNRAFFQSANKLSVRHNYGTKIFQLLRFNWFHVLLRWPTKWSLLLLLSVWTGIILLFAILYLIHDRSNNANKCSLGGSLEGDPPIQFAGAFAFSLETCTTVGYGLPNGINSFFERGCVGLQILIYFQMAVSLIFNAFLITFVYNRLGRSEARSIQVLFSDKALVSIVDDQVRFQVRLFDADTRHPVVEAHVRMYCVMKQRPVPRPLRILQPDDELGAMLLLSFPNVINHNIDMYSLLHPPVASILMKPKGLVLRQVDGYTASRDDVVCPICGESYGTFNRWVNHVRYQQVVEKQENYPIANTHLALNLAEIEKEPYSKPIQDIESLKQYFKHNVSEVLCVVEGIDPMQSGTFQALQSYRFEDIEWEKYAQFSPCLMVTKVANRKGEEVYTVDLDRYHAIVPDPDAEAEAKQAEEEQNYIQVVPTSASKQKAKPARKRHARMKTLSSGISDSLFS